MSRMAEHAMETQTFYEPVQADERVAAFNAAYAAAQGECENPPLDSMNPAFRSRFSSLAATRNAIIPVFSKHGIAIQQTAHTEMIGDRIYAGVRTVLRHKAGHVEDLGVCVMPVQKVDAQGFASCFTYAKRQSLQALAGCTGEVDDDAEGAVARSTPPAKPGIGVHSPLGDVQIDDRAVKYADAFKEALEGGDVRAVAADMREEDGHEELYRATWSLLDSKARSAIKRLLAEKAA